MLISDVVMQLAAIAPVFTDQFTTNADIVSLTRVGTTVTVETSAAHTFKVGKGVRILGTQTPIAISSFTRVGTIGTIVTDVPHDLTSGQGEQTTVQTQGATEAEFNDTFTISLIPNRSTLIVNIADAGAFAATGSPELINARSVLQQYDGYYEITSLPTTTSFTYETTLTNSDPVVTNAVARSAARVSGTSDINRALEAYTTQEAEELWAFVALDDTVSSKNRRIQSDAVSNTQRGDHFEQQILQNLVIFTITPSSNQIAGRYSRDNAEVLFRSICQSILFKRFDTQLYVGEYNPLQFVEHGTEQYNTAYYVHRYSFQQVAPLQFEDTVGYDESVAFRDMHIDMGVSTGTAILTADINLDDQPA